MAVLTESEIESIVKDRANFNVTTDSPISAAELLRFINDAYRDIWEISGGSRKAVAHATAWSVSPTADATGVIVGILTDINEVLRCWQSATSGSVGDSSGDAELQRVDLARIRYLRSQGTVLGTYAASKLYAVTRMATATAADVNKLRLDVYPGVASVYYPIEYIPQITLLTGASDVPDVNDLESADIALMAAMKIAPLIGRAELVPGIAADISERTRMALDRKYAAMQSGDQDSSKAN